MRLFGRAGTRAHGADGSPVRSRTAAGARSCVRSVPTPEPIGPEFENSSRARMHPRCAGQPVDPHGRRLYEAFAPTEARRVYGAWIPLHPQARKLAQTWWRSRSASCAASAWTAKSTIRSALSAKSPHGNASATPPAPASNGYHNRKSTHQNGSRLSRSQKVTITVTRY